MIELADASAVTYLIEGLKSGDLDQADAQAFIRTR